MLSFRVDPFFTGMPSGRREGVRRFGIELTRELRAAP
jgi:hypothetical protein